MFLLQANFINLIIAAGSQSIFSLTGLKRPNCVLEAKSTDPLFCYGELKLHYCLTQNYPYLRNNRVGPWNFTTLCKKDQDIFRHGIYEINLHVLEEKLNALETIENAILSQEFNFKNPKLNELNELLSTNRKVKRSELCEIPLDRHALPNVENAIEYAKHASGEIFLGIKCEFSRDFPDLYVPVIYCPPDVRASVEKSRWNPVDDKYLKITRNTRTTHADRERKPNTLHLQQLETILNCTLGYKLSQTESDLVWHYRFYLQEKYPGIALCKFMLAVRWEYSDQRNEALGLLKTWPEIESENVIGLLSKHFSHDICRNFAVQRLKNVKDEELDLYLYQLVQALRYELMKNVECLKKRRSLLSDETIEKKGFFLAEFLIDRALKNFSLANNLFWHLKVELELEDNSTKSLVVDTDLSKKKFSLVYSKLLERLRDGNAEQQTWHRQLESQERFVESLNQLLKYTLNESQNRQKRTDLLRIKLDDKDHFPDITNLSENSQFPFMLDTNFLVAKIDAESATFFKSKMQPVLLKFLNPKGEAYRAIFKTGDDLRQDQFVLLMIRFIDSILKRYNFDLRLTPYRVLATSSKTGFVEFIDSKPLKDILRAHPIQEFLRQNSPSPSDPLGIRRDVLENYVRSCAGYCVITYLLGVGDRHMENLMLTSSGCLFHIDFGFFLGYEPKGKFIGSQEVRLTVQMLEGMGDPESPQMTNFWRYCQTAFVHLRNHANELITMFELVVDAGIPHIQIDPVKACDFLKERFCLDLPEDKARERMVKKMEEAVRAHGPELLEKFHSAFQSFRN
ncbi:Phosphatidylinositol 3-kinase catalytic subunit type 3 [Cichlidogyrus casuarinus]|uniref:Phosphatidylinositol 3-kinase catalytic subunit type 3 n=1 Tax=Cichlidogyrus casuarinus TaxID=1844966 RepID=A0ABD2Q685_9PLAT